MVAKDFCIWPQTASLGSCFPHLFLLPREAFFSAHEDLTRLLLLFLILVLESMCLINAPMQGKGWRSLREEPNIGQSIQGTINANLSLGK